MAASPYVESTAATAAPTIKVDLLIAVSGPVDEEGLRERAAKAIADLRARVESPNSLRIAVASPGATLSEASSQPRELSDGIYFLRYPLASSAQPALPWLAVPAAYREISRLAESTEARACILLGRDLAAMEAAAIEAFARPLMDGSAQISVPVYPAGKYEALLNSGILYPFTRSLYGKQLRHPFAVDFGIAGGMIARLANTSPRPALQAIVSPAIDAAAASLAMTQSYVNALHLPSNDSIDLSTVLAKLCGAMFETSEQNAASWQRIRGSQPMPFSGMASPAIAEDNGVDARPLIESFNLGFRNLREVWSLVLPPVTLLELQRLSRLPAEQFRMPDQLWARVVYDFALAHRLRSIGRGHLLGALTPLYLGWVASHTVEVRAMDVAAAELRIERLAIAYEEAKPYFVSRWRWPDRFNP